MEGHNVYCRSDVLFTISFCMQTDRSCNIYFILFLKCFIDYKITWWLWAS